MPMLESVAKAESWHAQFILVQCRTSSTWNTFPEGRGILLADEAGKGCWTDGSDDFLP